MKLALDQVFLAIMKTCLPQFCTKQSMQLCIKKMEELVQITITTINYSGIHALKCGFAVVFIIPVMAGALHTGKTTNVQRFYPGGTTYEMMTLNPLNDDERTYVFYHINSQMFRRYKTLNNKRHGNFSR